MEFKDFVRGPAFHERWFTFLEIDFSPCIAREVKICVSAKNYRLFADIMFDASGSNIWYPAL